jgi:hypothetical protein
MDAKNSDALFQEEALVENIYNYSVACIKARRGLALYTKFMEANVDKENMPPTLNSNKLL